MAQRADERLVERVDQLLLQGHAVLETRHSDHGLYRVDFGKFKGFRSASLSFIAGVYGIDHTYYNEFASTVESAVEAAAESGIAILQAVRDEIAGGWLSSFKSLIVAEVFGDFLDMANYLRGQNYKDAAAVIAGSVLGEHLRRLCQKHSIDVSNSNNGKTIPMETDRLNAELASADVYSKLDQKSVTSWLDLRNNAAHGHYGKYNLDQVKNMITGVTEFMARLQA